ncbi:MAG: putative metal-binding motif-containing protein, partial [Deltaproteobacteria bacterium]|nr:putative metal-binding motif-containing protein [Deltaproteobacteria bacterium]
MNCLSILALVVLLAGCSDSVAAGDTSPGGTAGGEVVDGGSGGAGRGGAAGAGQGGGGAGPIGGAGGLGGSGPGGGGGPAGCQDDADGDGAISTLCGGADLLDDDASVHPGAAELCNGRDDDCDGEVDEGCPCEPGARRYCYPLGLSHLTLARGSCAPGIQGCGLSGWGPCDGAAAPSMERCDDQDNDCDGVVDGHGDALLDCRPACTPRAEVCDGLDDDCDGDVSDEPCSIDEQRACYTGPTATRNVGQCHDGVQEQVGEFLGQCEEERKPTFEICNGLDDDCDGTTDEGYVVSCGIGSCRVTMPACAGGDPQTCTPGTPRAETCNGLDDDCDGLIDDGPNGPAVFYADRDSDGFGDAANTMTACSAPAGWVSTGTDCDDSAAAVHP